MGVCVCVYDKRKREKRREGAGATASISSACDVAREAGGVQVLFSFCFF